jgi:hypothetical protein
MTNHQGRLALLTLLTLCILALFLAGCDATATLQQPPSTSIVGSPSISASFINQVLSAYHSPAAGKGQALYDLGVQYNIDPVWALAFFMHESTFGTKGEARASLSLGNLRCIPNYPCKDGYAWFPSWEAGFKSWYVLISNLYIKQWGLTTIAGIIHRYAPAADHNNESAYCAALSSAVQAWRSGQVYVTA